MEVKDERHKEPYVRINALPNRPTPKQKEKLDALVAWLAKTYKIDPSTIKGHGELAKTDCPGKLLEAYLPTLISHTRSALVADKGR